MLGGIFDDTEDISSSNCWWTEISILLASSEIAEIGTKIY